MYIYTQLNFVGPPKLKKSHFQIAIYFRISIAKKNVAKNVGIWPNGGQGLKLKECFLSV